MKIIIMGNGGSGKTWLSCKLSQLLDISPIHLDEIFWESGGFTQKRTVAEMMKRIDKTLEEASWIVEGVFGNLLEHYINDADLLIWLTTPWDICEERLVKRSREEFHHCRKQSESDMAALIKWASEYEKRRDHCAFESHNGLYKRFIGEKYQLSSAKEVKQLLEEYLIKE